MKMEFLSSHLIYALVMFSLVFMFSSYALANPATPESTHPDFARSSMRLKGFSDPEMDFQLMRSIGADWYGGGILGEILVAASEITDGDPSNWPKSFAQLVMQVEKDGRERLAKGHLVSARDALIQREIPAC